MHNIYIIFNIPTYNCIKYIEIDDANYDMFKRTPHPRLMSQFNKITLHRSQTVAFRLTFDFKYSINKFILYKFNNTRFKQEDVFEVSMLLFLENTF